MKLTISEGRKWNLYFHDTDTEDVSKHTKLDLHKLRSISLSLCNNRNDINIRNKSRKATVAKEYGNDREIRQGSFAGRKDTCSHPSSFQIRSRTSGFSSRSNVIIRKTRSTSCHNGRWASRRSTVWAYLAELSFLAALVSRRRAKWRDEWLEERWPEDTTSLSPLASLFLRSSRVT